MATLPTILVVDDEVRSQETLRRTLEEELKDVQVTDADIAAVDAAWQASLTNGGTLSYGSAEAPVVLREYWDTGVAILLFDEMATRAAAKGYQWIDLSLTSADNPYTPTLADRMGARLYKRYRVYRLAL